MSRITRFSLVLVLAHAFACGGDDGGDKPPADEGSERDGLYGACDSPLCTSGKCGNDPGLDVCTIACTKDEDCTGPKGEAGRCREVPVTGGAVEQVCVLP